MKRFSSREDAYRHIEWNDDGRLVVLADGSKARWGWIDTNTEQNAIRCLQFVTGPRKGTYAVNREDVDRLDAMIETRQ